MQMESEKVYPLSMAKAGQKVVIKRIAAGHGLNSRLCAMGLLPNSQVTVVTNNPSGPFVVSVKNTKLMLGRGMVQKIWVEQS